MQITNTPTDYFIRPAKTSEANIIANMWEAIDALIVEPPFGGWQANKHETQQKIIEQTIKTLRGNVWVTCYEKQIIATISVNAFHRPNVKQSQLAVIYGLWVEPQHRRSGVASKLLDTVKSFCRDQSVQALQVAWDHCNKDAEAFWRKKGFAPYEVIASQPLER